MAVRYATEDADFPKEIFEPTEWILGGVVEEGKWLKHKDGTSGNEFILKGPATYYLKVPIK